MDSCSPLTTVTYLVVSKCKFLNWTYIVFPFGILTFNRTSPFPPTVISLSEIIVLSFDSSNVYAASGKLLISEEDFSVKPFDDALSSKIKEDNNVFFLSIVLSLSYSERYIILSYVNPNGNTYWFSCTIPEYPSGVSTFS